MSALLCEDLLSVLGGVVDGGHLGPSISCFSTSVVAASQLPAQPEGRLSGDQAFGASLLQTAPQVSWVPPLLFPREVHVSSQEVLGERHPQNEAERRAQQG